MTNDWYQQVAAPALPAPSPPRRRRGILVAAAGVLVAMGGGVVVGLLIVRGGSSGGAESPQAAVEAFVGAVEANDVLAAVASIAPDEVGGAAELVESVAQQIDSLGLGRAIPGEGGGSSYSITADIDVGSVDDLADGVAGVDVSVQGELGIVEDDSLVGRILGGRSVDIDEFDVEIIAVEVDGGWYVSPMLTAGNTIHDLLEDDGYDVDRPDWAAVADTSISRGADDPLEAVGNMLEAAADLDVEALADSLGSGEARAARVFGDMIDGFLDDVEENGSADLDDFSLTDLGDGRVAVDSVEVTVEDRSDVDDGPSVLEFELDGDCLKVVDEYGDSGEGCFLRNVPLDPGPSEERIVLQTTKRDGSYVVEPVRSVFALASELVPQLSRQMVLLGGGVPAVDDPTPAQLDGVIDTELGSSDLYAVYEIAVPDGSSASLSYDGDVDVDVFVETEDGWWDETYIGSGVIEGANGGRVRAVVTRDCDDYDSKAILFPCDLTDEVPYELIARTVRDTAIAVPGVVSENFEPNEVRTFTFSIGSATEITVSSDADASWSLDGPYSYGNGDTLVLSPGAYVLTVTNTSSSDESLSVEMLEYVTPSLSRSNSSVVVDLSSGPVSIDLNLDAGEDVEVRADPLDGQDIVLTISGTSCNRVDLSTGIEECAFTVTTGGRFVVTVEGYADFNEYGSVSLNVYFS